MFERIFSNTWLDYRFNSLAHCWCIPCVGGTFRHHERNFLLSECKDHTCWLCSPAFIHQEHLLFGRKACKNSTFTNTKSLNVLRIGISGVSSPTLRVLKLATD